MQLKGQKLADVFASVYAKHLQILTEVKETPTIWASYHKGGIISVRGNGLPSIKSLRSSYPNGWTLSGEMRSGEARRKLATMEKEIQEATANALQDAINWIGYLYPEQFDDLQHEKNCAERFNKLQSTLNAIRELK